jgi:hypothetical protein
MSLWFPGDASEIEVRRVLGNGGLSKGAAILGECLSYWSLYIVATGFAIGYVTNELAYMGGFLSFIGGIFTLTSLLNWIGDNKPPLLFLLLKWAKSAISGIDHIFSAVEFIYHLVFEKE